MRECPLKTVLTNLCRWSTHVFIFAPHRLWVLTIHDFRDRSVSPLLLHISYLLILRSLDLRVFAICSLAVNRFAVISFYSFCSQLFDAVGECVLCFVGLTRAFCKLECASVSLFDCSRFWFVRLVFRVLIQRLEAHFIDVVELAILWGFRHAFYWASLLACDVGILWSSTMTYHLIKYVFSMLRSPLSVTSIQQHELDSNVARRVVNCRRVFFHQLICILSFRKSFPAAYCIVSFHRPTLSIRILQFLVCLTTSVLFWFYDPVFGLSIYLLAFLVNSAVDIG